MSFVLQDAACGLPIHDCRNSFASVNIAHFRWRAPVATFLYASASFSLHVRRPSAQCKHIGRPLALHLSSTWSLPSHLQTKTHPTKHACMHACIPLCMVRTSGCFPPLSSSSIPQCSSPLHQHKNTHILPHMHAFLSHGSSLFLSSSTQASSPSLHTPSATHACILFT